MKFTYNWLLDYFEPLYEFNHIIEGLLRLGLEVEKVKPAVNNFQKNLEGFTVAEILDAHKHNNADRLNVCKVNTINGIKDVVCGAPNARKGIKVIFADIGSYIPGADFTIVEKKIRGVKSYGMMLSEKELNISNNHDSIIEVSNNFSIGTPASKALGHLNDTIIEVSITPNLGHLLSVRNIAKSLASLGLGNFKEQDYPLVLKNIWNITNTNNYKVHKFYHSYNDYILNKDSKAPTKHSIDINIIHNNICNNFIAIKLNKVNNKNLLPMKISARLNLIEQKLINPIVDITNYLTIDLNHPMHAYDSTTLGNDLLVIYGNENDCIKALDKNTYDNLINIPLIKSNNKVISIAGIIGGLDSSSTSDSNHILLECAYFNPIEITKSINKLNINTTSGYHFQRGVNPSDLLDAINKAAYLIKEYLGYEIQEVYIYKKQDTPNVTSINTSCTYIKKVLGIESNTETINNKVIMNFLKNEGLDVFTQDNENYIINVPLYRNDIKTEADIAELILKLYGIKNITSKDFKIFSKNTEFNKPVFNTFENTYYYKTNKLLDKSFFNFSLAVKKSLATLGLLESINMSFISENIAKLFNIYNPELHLSNPISNELAVMRSSLLPSLVVAATNNHQAGYKDIAFFEVANIYNSLPSYSLCASAILSGVKHRKDWRFKSYPYSIFDIKELMLNFLNTLGVNPNLLCIKNISNTSYSFLHPHKSGIVCIEHNNTEHFLGYFGELHPYKTLYFSLKNNPVVFEINLNNLLYFLNSYTTPVTIKQITKLMPLERDFAFIMEKSIPAIDIIKVISNIDTRISDIKIFDVYDIDKFYKSIGVSITITPLDKTLNDTEINNLSQNIIKTIELKTGGRLREENLNIK